MPFLPEPPFTHGKLPVNKASTAVLLCNLGTPDAPTTSAVRRFLREFLSDHRVVEIPKPIWWLILNGIILNIRPKKSAAKYATVWMPEGSPLRVHTERQTSRFHIVAQGKPEHKQTSGRRKGQVTHGIDR